MLLQITRSLLLLSAFWVPLTLVPKTVWAATSFQPPKLVKDGSLKFPTIEGRRGREAFIVYSYEISTDGDVNDVRIEYSNNLPRFEKAIIDWAHQRKFEPALLNGEPVVFRETKQQVFIQSENERGVQRRFSPVYKTAAIAINEGQYDKAETAIRRMQAMDKRSLYEELHLQYIWSQLHHARGERALAYKRLNVMGHFLRFHVQNAEEDQIVQIEKDSFFQNPFIQGYNFEVDSLMLADAERTLKLLEKLFPNADSTKQARTHFDSITGLVANKAFQTEGEILPDPYYGNQPRWVGALSRRSFSLKTLSGQVSSVLLRCKQGEFALDYKSNYAWEVPANWRNCELEITGDSNTKLAVIQKPDR